MAARTPEFDRQLQTAALAERLLDISLPEKSLVTCSMSVFPNNRLSFLVLNLAL